MVDRSLTLGTLFSANVRDFVNKVDLIKKKVGQLNATMASVGKKAQGFNTASKSITSLDKSMEGASKTSGTFSKQLGVVGGAMNTVLSAAKTTASFMAAGMGIGAIVQSLRLGTKEIIDFDQALKNLQAITKSTDAEVAGMGEVIKQVANETKFSTGEVAEGMVLLGQAGFSVQEAMQAMSSVANLATGTLSDMRMTSDLLTTTIRAFNLSTVESARVADVMANAINRSKLNIDKLRIAFNFAGAASAQAGLSIEETAASMMLLANNGFRASTIGTGLRQVMSRMLAPNRKLREEFKEQGIALEKVNPATQGWSKALKNLIPVLVNTETGLVDMAKAYQLFGLRGAQAAAVLAKSMASGDYEKMIEFTMEVGSAARMAGTQMEGLGVKIKNLADRLKLIAVAIGEAGLTDFLKLLIDALRETAKAVADFVNSELGKLVTGFVGWTLAIYGTIKALKFLGIGIKLLIRPIIALVASMTALQASTSASVSGFGLLIQKIHILIRSFGAWAVAIGAVVAVVRHWVTSIEREIKALEKTDAKTQTVIQTLGLYSSKLDELIEKKKKDEDVTKEHSKLLERFRADLDKLEEGYGELNVALDDNTDSLQKNKDAVEELKRQQLWRSVQQNIDLIETYNKQIERTNFWMSLWNFAVEDTIGWINNLVKAFTLLGDRILSTLSDALDWLVDKLRSIGPAMEPIVFAVENLEKLWKNFWGNAGRDVDAFVDKYSGQSKKVVKLTEDQRNAFVRAAQGLNLLGEGAKSIEEIVETLEGMTGQKIDAEGIELITQALQRVTKSLEDQKEKWNETFDSIPDVFHDMFMKLDLERKVDASKAIKTLAAQAAAWEKQAEILGATDAQIAAGRMVLYAKGLAELERNKDKEVKISIEAANKILESLTYLESETERIYNQASAQTINRYVNEYDVSQKSKTQLLNIEKQFTQDLARETQEREQSLSEIGKQRHSLYLQLERQAVREITKLNIKMYKDLQTQLRKRLRDAQNVLADLQQAILNLDQDHQRRLREIRQSTMTDEERWLDDRAQAHRLFNQALETMDEELFKEAMNLAASLNREVRNQQGEVVRSLSNTAIEATRILSAMYETQRSAFQEAAYNQQQSIDGIQQSLARVEDKVKSLKANINELNSTELALEMDESLADMKRMHNITSAFKHDWDSLRSKTITLTVRYKTVGKPPANITPSQPADASVEAEAAGAKYGGLIRKKIGGMVHKALSLGGGLPGFGGGDKVRALLEPGEFVIRKEAVKKVGANKLHAINSMKVSSGDVGTTVASRMGGMIKKAMEPVRKLASGGVVVPPFGQMAAPVNIYIQPKYMIGDRQAARVMAVDISKAIDEKNRRWGR